MKLTMYGIKDRAAWEEAGIALPGYDVEAVSARAKEAPVWVHFGIGNIFRIFTFTLPNEGTDTALCCSVRNGVRNIIVKQGRYFAVFQHFRISFNFFFPLIQRFKISFFCLFQPLFCGLKIFSDDIWLGDLILKVSPLLLHAKI